VDRWLSASRSEYQARHRTARIMARTRIIDCIGASDEDIAHIRLLLRSSRIHLQEVWRWGTEDQADLVIVDTSSLIGESARRRTHQRGIVCARLIGVDDPSCDGRYLRKPLKREDFVALLDGIGSSTVAPLAILTQGDDFFDLDLGEPDFSDMEDLAVSLSGEDEARREAIRREHEAFHDTLRRDPLAAAPQFLIPEGLSEGVGVEFVRDATVRSASRANASAHPFQSHERDDSFIDPRFRRDLEAVNDDDATWPLIDYLTRNLLGGPARIVLPGHTELVLDPKNVVFHAEGRMPALEGYCRQPLRVGDWRRLVNYELDALRLRVPARPYLRLIWTDRFIRSDGYLASHLDPGGTYRLTRWLELAQDYPRAFRVGANMMQPLKLHEIARASEVGLAEVFDVVNAYEAIGYVEWAHRERFQRRSS
jgi:hypothetical protein